MATGRGLPIVALVLEVSSASRGEAGSQGLPASRLPGRGRWVRPAARGRRGAVRQPRLLPYLFIAPAVGLTALFSLVPLGIALHRSFYGGGNNFFQTKLNFVGFQNYRDALSSGGAQALEVTAIYTIGFIVLAMGFGLAIALLLNMKLPGIDRLRAPFIIPVVVPVVATALIWANLFAPQFGLINRILQAVGLHQADFTSSPSLALIMVLTFGVWQFFGENVILYLAALKSLPVDLMEAASVDGAGAWRRFRFVRWPLLRRATAVILVITTLTGLQTFTQIYILTGGGPNGATAPIVYEIYNKAFVQFNTGQADALSGILFLISLAITIVVVATVGRGSRRDA
jgi:ABC-type sugar transport system permease subunit